MNDATAVAESSWWVRNEFLLRRLHSLSGLVPVGAFMMVHLVVNASLLNANSAATFQANVLRIHGLGRLLWVVEWMFIFLPLIFHAVLGLIIIRGAVPNTSTYPYGSNIRYTLQRVTGILAFLFIGWHVFHMHGWFHFEGWVRMARSLEAGSLFRPFNAASSVFVAMHSPVVAIVYAVGILACVFHLANGIWTMGITWGVWTSPAGQQRANWIALMLGLALATVGIAALIGTQTFWRTGSWLETVQDAMQTENEMIDAKRDEQQIAESEIEHKRWKSEDPDLQKKENEELKEAWLNVMGRSEPGGSEALSESTTAPPAPTR